MDHKNNPTEDNLTKYLMEQIDQELEKPFEEQNMEYIEECSQKLYRITGDRYDPEPVAREESVEKIKRLAEKKIRKKMLIKRLEIVAAAACLVFVVMGGGIAWADGDYSQLPFGDLLYRMALILQPGEAVDIEDDTFYKPITYSTIEEFFEDQDVSVLYPTWLPEGVELEKIQFYQEDADKKEMYYVFSDSEIQFMIFLYNKYSNVDEVFAGVDSFELDGVMYYIRETQVGKMNVAFNREGYFYSITVRNLEDLQGILKGLEMKD